MPKLKRQAQDVLGVYHRLNARPGDCLQYVTLVRNGIDEDEVEDGVNECARLGHVVRKPECAELTLAGWRAIGWKDGWRAQAAAARAKAGRWLRRS